MFLPVIFVEVRFNRSVSDSILAVEVTCCNIVEILGVVQVMKIDLLEF